MLINLRLKIIEHYLTYDKFAEALQKKGHRIDASVISRIVNNNRNPTPPQRKVFIQMLKTPAIILFKENPDV